MHQTSTIFNSVFAKDLKEPSNPPSWQEREEALHADAEQEDYRHMQGRWRRDACAAAASHDHWMTLGIAHCTRAPAAHLMH
eukprot:13444952-Alexandrium_andersonii.AAC.1